jgi:antiviral helicase SLH1
MIAEMDGLCQRTFRGYQSLNRMQSLVYPVAYQTSENMLICAPTGAVSQLLSSTNYARF